MLAVTWGIFILNLLFRQGWMGGFGQILFTDYVVLYAAGLAHLNKVIDLYNFDIQFQLQQSIIAPTNLPGLNPFTYPPYVGYAYSLLARLPIIISLITWFFLSLGFILVAVRLLHSFLPLDENGKSLGHFPMLVMVLSFFPVVSGMQTGQNNCLTLLLISCAALFTLQGSSFVAGIAGGLMIYKPQFILGFLIIWLVWKQWKALTAFMIVSGLWVGSYFVLRGFTPFIDYANTVGDLLLLPYVQGFPNYLIITLYGFLSSIFPLNTQPIVLFISEILLVVMGIFVARIAKQANIRISTDRIPAINFAILFPLIAAPYALAHDLIVLIPFFVLWVHQNQSSIVIRAIVATYICTFFFYFAGGLLAFPFVAIIPVALFSLYANERSWIQRKSSTVS